MVSCFERHNVNTTIPSASAAIASQVTVLAGSCLLRACGRAPRTGGCFALPVQTVSFNRGRGNPKNILRGI